MTKKKKNMVKTLRLSPYSLFYKENSLSLLTKKRKPYSLMASIFLSSNSVRRKDFFTIATALGLFVIFHYVLFLVNKNTLEDFPPITTRPTVETSWALVFTFLQDWCDLIYLTKNLLHFDSYYLERICKTAFLLILSHSHCKSNQIKINVKFFFNATINFTKRKIYYWNSLYLK